MHEQLRGGVCERHCIHGLQVGIGIVSQLVIACHSLFQTVTMRVCPCSVRTHSWRYTGWYRWSGDKCVADWETGPFFGEELYAHTSTTPVAPNFNDENVNVAMLAVNADVKAQLRQMVESHFKSNDVRGCPPNFHRS